MFKFSADVKTMAARKKATAYAEHTKVETFANCSHARDPVGSTCERYLACPDGTADAFDAAWHASWGT